MGNICDSNNISNQVDQHEGVQDLLYNYSYVKKHTIKSRPKKLKLLDRNVVKVRTLNGTIKITTNHKRLHKKTEYFVKKYRIAEELNEESSANEESVEIHTQC